MNLIKLIWDFKGPISNKTAHHFNSHLQEFLVIEKMIDYKTFLEKFSDYHSIVFVTIDVKDLDFYQTKTKTK